MIYIIATWTRDIQCIAQMNNKEALTRKKMFIRSCFLFIRFLISFSFPNTQQSSSLTSKLNISFFYIKQLPFFIIRFLTSPRLSCLMSFHCTLGVRKSFNEVCLLNACSSIFSRFYLCCFTYKKSEPES